MAGGFAGVEVKGAVGAGEGLGQRGAVAEDLAAGEREALAADFQAPAPAFPLPVVHHRPGEGVADPAVEARRHEHMPAAPLDDEPSAAFVPVA